MSRIEPRLNVDYLILTVKKVELTACLRAFGISVGAAAHELGHGMEVWRAEVGGRTFAIAMVGTAGNVESAVRLGALLTLIRTRAAILIGMAAGVVGETDVGDVVVAEAVIAFEFVKMRESGPVYMPRTYSPPDKHINRVELLDVVDPNWPNDVCDGLRRVASIVELPDEPSDVGLGVWRPRVRRGAVLAGSKLIEDGSLPSLVSDLHGRALAAEMEGAGFAAACDESDTPWLVVRGVSDHGQLPRPKDWQFTAAYAASRFVLDGIRLQRIDLLSA